jgi:hypothetical protein
LLLFAEACFSAKPDEARERFWLIATQVFAPTIVAGLLSLLLK